MAEQTTSKSPHKGQLCDVCWKVDTAPRHVSHVAANFPGATPTDADIEALDERHDVTASMVRAVLDPTTVIRHHDCCAERGCPTGLCTQVLEVVGNAKDDELRSLIQTGAVAHLSDSTEEV